MKIVRLVLTAIAVEVLTVLVLVVLVAVFGPSDPDQSPAYAERLGYWVGPIGGFVFCLLGGWWLARGAGSSAVRIGLLLGTAVAAIDTSILVASGADFEWIFVVSNIGRVVAGGLGGWLAGRSAREA